MAEGKITKRAQVSSNQREDLYAEWRAKRTAILEGLQGGEAQASPRVSMASTRKYYLRNPKTGNVDDIFVRVEYSCGVTVNCPQTDEGIQQAKTVASELAMEENTRWLEEAEVNVLQYLTGEGLD